MFLGIVIGALGMLLIGVFRPELFTKMSETVQSLWNVVKKQPESSDGDDTPVK